MLNSQIINKIYEEMLDIILKDINLEYKDFIARGYYNYLNNVYHSFDFSKTDFDKAIKFVKDSQIRDWGNTSNEYRLKKLVNDNNLIRIKNLSGLAYSYAVKKLSGEKINIDKEIIHSKIAELQELLLKVKEYNTEEAKELVSEGILDFIYASSDTTITSLRIGHITDK